MNLRLCLASLLLVLGGCAPTLQYPPGQTLLGQTPSKPAWSAASVRAEYDATWKTRRIDQRFHVRLRTLGSMGRLDLTTPAGSELAQVRWDGSQWEAFLPASGTLVEGEGDALPLPMLGMAAFPFREIERLARGVLFPPGVQGRALNTLYAGKGSRVLLTAPDSTAHRWALHVEEKTGIVRRVQCFQGPVQESDLQVLAFVPGTLIPQELRREFDTASVLALKGTVWSERPFVSPTELAFRPSSGLDTVSVGQDRLGRRFYTIRPSRPDSLPPFPSDFLAGARLQPDAAAPELDDEDTAQLEDDTLDEDSTLAVDEEDLEEEGPTAVPAAPTLPAILKEPAPAPAAPLPEPPPAGDLAPPPSEATPRRF